ncbi:Staphylococcal nuclease domain-containing protein 1 [Geodia barretti]|uniref:Staphylococcal nuclease domain-containing protein 1 n=1 Tax=Geodia barretti TaxID=519541 RepID=A0AA35T822_GEOBA|nr:Staphylococcal nuclease domain-containing protein 1 [Geodia barretti]
MYTKELIMQREVEIEVDACDKGGNFIGWLYYEGRNLSVSLLEEGLSKIGPLADRTAHFNALLSAEKKAKELKKICGRIIWRQPKKNLKEPWMKSLKVKIPNPVTKPRICRRYIQ